MRKHANPRKKKKSVRVWRPKTQCQKKNTAFWVPPPTPPRPRGPALRRLPPPNAKSKKAQMRNVWGRGFKNKRPQSRSVGVRGCEMQRNGLAQYGGGGVGNFGLGPKCTWFGHLGCKRCFFTGPWKLGSLHALCPPAPPAKCLFSSVHHRSLCLGKCLFCFFFRLSSNGQLFAHGGSGFYRAKSWAVFFLRQGV